MQLPFILTLLELYLAPCDTSTVKLFAKIFNSLHASVYSVDIPERTLKFEEAKNEGMQSQFIEIFCGLSLIHLFINYTKSFFNHQLNLRKAQEIICRRLWFSDSEAPNREILASLLYD